METVKLLIVDDNVELRRVVADYFAQREGVSVVGQASNGVEALELIRQTQPDVLLSDIIMPQMDGYTMLEQLLRMDIARKPEVIVLTALGRDDFITRAVQLGVRYYMIKPFDFPVLYQRVMEVASTRGAN